MAERERELAEKLLADVRRRRDDAEAVASHAAENLVRLASGLTRLAELDPDHVRAAADDFAGAIERLKLLEGFARDVRGVLM